jgi:hypothetical protein
VSEPLLNVQTAEEFVDPVLFDSSTDAPTSDGGSFDSDSFVMTSPFFSKGFKNRRWPIVPYSYIHSDDNKGDCIFESRHPEWYFISCGENCFPQSGHFWESDFAILTSNSKP